MAGDEVLGFSRRKAVLAVGLAILLAVGAFGLVGQIANFGDLRRSVERADRLWFPLALLGEVLAYLGYIVAYRAVAAVAGGPRLSFWTATRVVGLGFGAFVVGSSAGGLAVEFWALKRAGLDAHAAARRVLALNTLEWAVLAWFATAAGALLLAGLGKGAPLGMALAWLCVVPACTVAAAFVTQPGRVERLAALGRDDRGGSRVERALGAARRGLGDAIAGVAIVRELLLQPRRHGIAAAGFVLYWAGDLLTLYASLRAFGAHVGPAALVLAYATAYVATALPLPAGGAGSIEVALALTLHGVGVPLAPALLAAFLYRVFAFWLPIVPALLLLPSAARLDDDLPQSPRPDDRSGR